MRHRRIGGNSTNVSHHVGPRLPTIERDLNVSIVSTRPNLTALQGRLAQRDNRAVVFGRRVFNRYWPTGVF